MIIFFYEGGKDFGKVWISVFGLWLYVLLLLVKNWLDERFYEMIFCES